jgi:hypothetical protein
MKQAIFLVSVFLLNMVISGCKEEVLKKEFVSTDPGGVIFKRWVHETDKYYIDLEQAEFGQNISVKVLFDHGPGCDVDVDIDGNETDGSLTFSNSIYDGGSPADPGCAIFNGPRSYEVFFGTFVVCQVGTQCEHYE